MLLRFLSVTLQVTMNPRVVDHRAAARTCLSSQFPTLETAASGVTRNPAPKICWFYRKPQEASQALERDADDLEEPGSSDSRSTLTLGFRRLEGASGYWFHLSQELHAVSEGLLGFY